MKKYNSSTGCYKIDIFVNGGYLCSTAQAKTCKEAVERYKKAHPEHDTPENRIYARFDRS